VRAICGWRGRCSFLGPLLPDPLNDNVATVASIRASGQRRIGRHQRWIERFTAEVGRPRSLYVIVGFVVVWVTDNLLAPTVGARSFDPPPFQWLQGLVGFSALLTTMTVLVTQSRQSRDFEQRAELELQVNLLAEQKAAKIIGLLEELRRDIPTVSNRVDPVADAMQEPMDPRAVLSALEATFDSKISTPEGAEGAAPPKAHR
jgi:uncharacterized membrane protein